MTLLTIPVWTIPPDWASPVKEGLEWKTQILASVTSVEQRRALRLSPRRYLDYNVTVAGRWRSYYDALLTTQYQEKFYVPLWHEVALTVGALSESDTVITVKGTPQELRNASVLFVQGTEPWLFDLLEVTSVSTVSGNSRFIVAGGGTTQGWPANTPVFAATVALLTAQPGFTRVSDSAYQAAVRFDFDGDNDWATSPTLDTYRDSPVIAFETNENGEQSGSYFRQVSTLDNDIGLRRHRDFAGIAFGGFNSNNFVTGRTATDDIRSILYYLKGRCNVAWFVAPTNDFTLVTGQDAGSFHIDVERNGFADLNGPTEGRRDICIELNDGTKMYRRITLTASVNSTTDRLALFTALDVPVWPSNVARISFLSLGRLDQDLIELSHVTDTDGACDYSLATKLVPDLRTGADWTPTPFPLSEEGDCGPTIPGRLWVKKTTDKYWNNNPAANPSIGVGGYDISDLLDDGPLFPVLGLDEGFFGYHPVSVNFGLDPFIGTIPRRALPWGPDTILNPADKDSQVVLTGGNLTAYVAGEVFRKYVRANTSDATQTGLRYFELTVDASDGHSNFGFYQGTLLPPQEWYLGFASADFVLSQPLFDPDPSHSVIISFDKVHLNGDQIAIWRNSVSTVGVFQVVLFT